MLLIDCYNVLHAPMPPMLAGLDEGGLCAALGRTDWAAHGKGIVVVADGQPKPGRASVSPSAAVELVFSGPGRSADDVIVERIDAHPAPRRLTVVSSDRAIRAAARRRRARSWTAEHFVHKLCEQLRPLPGNRDASQRPSVDALPEEHVEGWMDEMGLTEADAKGLPPDTSGPRRSDADSFDLDGLDMDELETDWGFDPKG